MGNMNFFKGMGAGLIVGACIGMTCGPDKKYCRRKLGKTIRNVGEMIENITESLGF